MLQNNQGKRLRVHASATWNNLKGWLGFNPYQVRPNPLLVVNWPLQEILPLPSFLALVNHPFIAPPAPTKPTI